MPLGFGRSTGVRETVHNLFHRRNRAGQTPGAAPEADDRTGNRDRITRTAEMGSGRRRPELPGEPVVATHEIGQGRELSVQAARAAVQAASTAAEIGPGRQFPGRPAIAPNLNRDLPDLPAVPPQEMGQEPELRRRRRISRSQAVAPQEMGQGAAFERAQQPYADRPPSVINSESSDSSEDTIRQELPAELPSEPAALPAGRPLGDLRHLPVRVLTEMGAGHNVADRAAVAPQEMGGYALPRRPRAQRIPPPAAFQAERSLGELPVQASRTATEMGSGREVSRRATVVTPIPQWLNEIPEFEIPRRQVSPALGEPGPSGTYRRPVMEEEASDESVHSNDSGTTARNEVRDEDLQSNISSSNSATTRTSQQSRRSVLRRREVERREADLQLREAALARQQAEMGIGSPPPAYTSQAESVLSDNSATTRTSQQSRRSVLRRREVERREAELQQQQAALQQQQAEIARHQQEAAAARQQQEADAAALQQQQAAAALEAERLATVAAALQEQQAEAAREAERQRIAAAAERQAADTAARERREAEDAAARRLRAATAPAYTPAYSPPSSSYASTSTAPAPSSSNTRADFEARLERAKAEDRVLTVAGNQAYNDAIRAGASFYRADVARTTATLAGISQNFRDCLADVHRRGYTGLDAQEFAYREYQRRYT